MLETEKVEERFKKLENHLNILLEYLNTDLDFLTICEGEQKKTYEDKMKLVMRRICLYPDAREWDVTFLHEDFRESLYAYEEEVCREFNEVEQKHLSEELKLQMKPEEFEL